MSLVESLGTDFAGVIDPHEACSMGLLALIQVGIDDVFGGVGASGPAGRCGHGAQGVIGAGEESVQRRQLTFFHSRNYSETPRSTGILRALLYQRAQLIFRRFRMVLRVLVAVAALAAPLHLMAQEAAEPESPWSGKATLGYLATSGNTENSTLNTGFEVGFATGKWAHQLAGAAVNASENEVTTAEAYDLGWKSERRISDKDFLFGRLDWRKDRFGGFDTQFSQSVGYGRRLMDSDKHKLNAEIGVGARQSEALDGTEENETIARTGLYYKWLFSETAEFRQDVTAESGGENTYLESVTAISAKLMGDLALVASYTIKHNTDVPALTEETDTYTALSLEYSF